VHRGQREAAGASPVITAASRVAGIICAGRILRYPDPASFLLDNVGISTHLSHA
jgi:hypothetical protein